MCTYIIYYRTVHTEGGNVVRSYTIPWELLGDREISSRSRANRTNSYRVLGFCPDLISSDIWNNLTLLMLVPFILLSLAESILLSYRGISPYRIPLRTHFSNCSSHSWGEKVNNNDYWFLREAKEGKNIYIIVYSFLDK